MAHTAQTSQMIRPACCGAAAAVLFAVASAASGGISAASEGTALDVNVNLLGGGLGINVVAAHAAGAAPASYFDSDLVLSAAASALGVASLSTGVLTADASSDVEASSSAGQAFGASQVNGLSFDIVPTILGSLVSLDSDTIGSSALVGWDGSQFSSNAGFVIEDADLVVAGVGSIFIDANAAPNTVLLDLAGIRIVLNEQILTQNGDTLSLEVNAIHITVDPLLNVVDADVVIGHSFATMTVPTPGAGALAGLGGLMAARRRRRCR